MSSFWTNPWVTGIGGGIVSSLIVFFVTKYFFNKKDSNEYAQKIKFSNNEILHAIRPLIMAHKIPTKGIFSSLRTAISNRYNVKLDDLYNHKSISNDMIAEILENPFLTPNQKEEFCNHILCFKHAEQENSSEALDLSDKTRSNSNLTSIILALCSFTMMLSLSLLLTDNIEKYNSSKQLFWDNTFLFASVTIIPLLLVIIFYYLSRIPAKAIRHRSHINNKI